jgi:hypothetical protein
MRKADEILREQQDRGYGPDGDGMLTHTTGQALRAIEQAQREVIEEVAALCDADASRHRRIAAEPKTQKEELRALCFEGAYTAAAQNIRRLLK